MSGQITQTASQYKCADCEKSIASKKATRCRKCNGLFRSAKRVVPVCLDCSKPVYRRNSRCRKCQGLRRRKPLGNKHPCVDCGKPLWWGTVRCKRCSGIARRVPPNICVRCGGKCISTRCLACYQSEEGRLWTEGELQVLKSQYRFVPAAVIGAKLNRSASAVTHRAHFFGLTGDRRTHGYDNWSYVIGNPYESIPSSVLQYIAGVYDGEGDLGCRGRHWQFGITNTNKELLEFVQCHIAYSSISWSERGNGYKRCGRLSLAGNLKIYRLLMLLLPSLIVKREKATQAIRRIEDTERDIFEFYRAFAAGHVQSGQR